MKLLKTLLPLVGTVATAASIAPLATSCSTNSNTLQYNFSYDYRSIDGLTPYEPKFEPLAQQQADYPSRSVWEDDMYILYTKSIEKDWRIYADDMLCGTYATLLSMVQSDSCAIETMDGTAKITIDNFEITYDDAKYEYYNTARISWTEELNINEVWTLEDSVENSRTLHGNLYRKIKYNNIPLFLDWVHFQDNDYLYWATYDADDELLEDKTWSIEFSERTEIDGSQDAIDYVWDRDNTNYVYIHNLSRMNEFWAWDYEDILDDSNNGTLSRASHYVLDDKIMSGAHYLIKNYYRR